MPVVGGFCPTPEREARHLGNGDEVLTKRPMVDYDERDALGCGSFQSRDRSVHQLFTPLISGVVWIRVKQRLISRHDVFFFRPGKRALAADMVWPEAVVV